MDIKGLMRREKIPLNLVTIFTVIKEKCYSYINSLYTNIKAVYTLNTYTSITTSKG